MEPRSRGRGGGTAARPPVRPARRGDLISNLVGFCRLLRGRGLGVGPAEAADALRALAAVDLLDRHETYLALRAVLASGPDAQAIFDAAFWEFWRFPESAAPAETGRAEELPPIDGAEALQRVLREWGEGAGGDEERERAPTYSPAEVLTRKEFGSFSADELDEISAVLAAIARRVATRVSRRMRHARRGRVLDIRRTLRRSLRRGGEMTELLLRERRVQKTRIVLLCDVSGSMDLYSRFLIQFIYSLQHVMGRVDTYVFSTGLSRITGALRRDDLRAALDEVSRQVPDWSGGTKIGRSVQSFLDEHGARSLSGRTVVIIISDGWDTGDADLLAAAMRELRRRADRVIWLNPLLASPGYEPICQGMRVALPYVDVFAPAHNLESLRRLERYLAG